MDLISVTEGQTTILAPVHDENSPFPPGTAPVFYNPRMALNRDATVLTTSILKPDSYLDAMGATGLRGCRVGYESNISVTINDRDIDAVNLIRTNVSNLNLNAEVTCRDANALMHERRFGFVDLDPFGTPAPFLDSALCSAGKYLGVTATDTAPLCGAHLKAGIRRYMARPLNTEYHTEVALRILLGYITRRAAMYDRAVEPLFCFAREHFIRLHLRLKNSAGASDRSIDRLGYIYNCPSCPYREEESSFFPSPKTCPVCGKKMKTGGPIWTGSIQDSNFMETACDMIPTLNLEKNDALLKILTTCRVELPSSFYYNYHQVAKYYKCSPGPIEAVINTLQENGYDASRVHYSGYGLKTNAPLEEIKMALKPQ